MRLRDIYEANFHFGPWTLNEIWEAHRKKNKWPQLKMGEVTLLISKKREQLLFLSPTTKLSDGQVVLDTRRLSLKGVGWNPLRIKEYAAMVGIDLEGLKNFEEHYEALRMRKMHGDSKPSHSNDRCHCKSTRANDRCCCRCRRCK